MIFAVDVQKEEDPLTWIESPPNLGVMDASERQQLQNQVVEIGTCLRSIYYDLMTSERADTTAERLASDILAHLRASATCILKRSLGLACWEAHQAAEKSLKLLSHQKTGSYDHTHELKELLQKLGDIRVGEDFIKELPTKERVIRMRANEGPAVALPEAYKIYRVALPFVRQCAEAMPRKLGIRNARFLLAKAPYVE